MFKSASEVRDIVESNRKIIIENNKKKYVDLLSKIYVKIIEAAEIADTSISINLELPREDYNKNIIITNDIIKIIESYGYDSYRMKIGDQREFYIYVGW